jgi:hypothetical protein
MLGESFTVFILKYKSALNATKEKNMNKAAAAVLAGVMAFGLSACSSPNYVMHTNDGRTIVADGKPQTDDETGMISYKDANGNKQQINRTDVKEMVELDQ